MTVRLTSERGEYFQKYSLNGLLWDGPTRFSYSQPHPRMYHVHPEGKEVFLPAQWTNSERIFGEVFLAGKTRLIRLNLIRINDPVLY